MREILFPAHHLLHQSTEPLTVPSTTYDTLRASLVQAELVLLRVIGFELRLQTPLVYLPRYLERAMEDVTNVGEKYDEWGKEEKEEYGVLDNAMETSIGRACRHKAVSASVTQPGSTRAAQLIDEW